jgi:hypothetical protein
MEKTIITACPRPFLKLTVSAEYAEVQKPTGVGYIILELIMDSKKRDERLAAILRRFGVPDDLMFIFADELELLLARNVLKLTGISNYNRSSFEECIIGCFDFTENGEMLFRDGVAPTGETKVKSTDLFLDPVIQKLMFSAPKGHSENARKSYYDASFSENLAKIMEPLIAEEPLREFMADNYSKLRLSEEERILECKIVGKECQVITGSDVAITVNESGLGIRFDSAETEQLFSQLLSPELIESIIGENEDLIFTIKYTVAGSFQSFRHLHSIHTPGEYKSLFESPMALRINNSEELFSVKHGEAMTQLHGSSLRSAADTLSKNWSFIAVDKQEVRFFTASRLQLPASTSIKPIGVVGIHLLVEELLQESDKSLFFSAVIDDCIHAEFSKDHADIVRIVAEQTNQVAVLAAYMESKIKFSRTVVVEKKGFFAGLIKAKTEEVVDSGMSSEERTGVLLSADEVFSSIQGWENIASEYADRIFDGLISQLNANNAANTVMLIKSIDSLRSADNESAIRAVTKVLDNPDTVEFFNSLVSIGFDIDEVLPFANIVEVYISSILAGETALNESQLSEEFSEFALVFQSMRDNLGIYDTAKYSIKDNYNTEEFCSDFSLYSERIDRLMRFEEFAPDSFKTIERFTAILHPIFDQILIERDAAQRPDQISKEYVRTKINTGNWRVAVGDLIIRLDYVLGKLLSGMVGDGSDVFEKINLARDEELITEQEASELHSLRMLRNWVHHPRQDEPTIDTTEILKWAEFVFSIQLPNQEK